MFINDIDPVLVSIGPFSIRYYGLIFVFGILFSYFIFKYLAKRRKLPLSGKDIDDAIVYGVIGAVLGARLGSVISEFGYYAANPLQIFALWNGGMAFHGGLAGLIIAGYYYSKKKKINFYAVADLIVIPVALALAFGRIANFINGEFYGTPTSLPWGVKFSGLEGFRHPVQLYESAKNLFIFAFLWAIKDKNPREGTLFWLFIASYGALRFLLEFYKDLPPLIFSLTWGQVWSLPMFIIGACMLYKLKTLR
ncbi:prolipoprotein diacylglyceryl transferase [Candidatus Woesearchaeota archaeon]|nr:prolipoprotein diacylglyceryl transferase [Candidatus Woesearchaeota archaeon]